MRAKIRIHQPVRVFELVGRRACHGRQARRSRRARSGHHACLVCLSRPSRRARPDR